MIKTVTILGLLPIFVFSVASAEIVLTHEKAVIESVSCEVNPSVSFHSEDNGIKTLPFRNESPKGVRLKPMDVCKSLSSFASSRRAINLVTVPTFNNGRLDSETVIGFVDKDYMRVLTPIYDKTVTPMKPMISYIRSYRCGNPDRSSRFCLMRDENNNFYFNFKSYIPSSSTIYMVLATTKSSANMEEFKTKDEDGKELLLKVSINTEEIKASLLIDGEMNYPEFDFPLAKK